MSSWTQPFAAPKASEMVPPITGIMLPARNLEALSSSVSPPLPITVCSESIPTKRVVMMPSPQQTTDLMAAVTLSSCKSGAIGATMHSAR